MLTGLTIQNVVLIDRLSVAFGAGLCALTGETGAGKSILLDSLGLALGARSESGLVRKGSDSASVTAEFDLPDGHAAFGHLKDSDLAGEGNSLILRRSIGKDGKSRAYINDHPVSVALLKSVGDLMVEIHGQFDTQALLNPKTHRALLDEYAGNAEMLARLRGDWETLREARDALKSAALAIEKARSDEVYYRAALEQLEELSPKDGEEEKLTTLRTRLMKREQNIDLYNAAHAAGEEAATALNAVWRALDKAGERGDVMAAVDRALAEMQEVSAGIETLSASLEDSEYSLTEIDDRLFALKAQARKHACTIDELPSKLLELKGILDGMNAEGGALAALEKKVAGTKQTYEKNAREISARRKKAGQTLDRLVQKELAPLKLEKARFETSVEDLQENERGPEGIDRVQFLVATNPGAAAGPLNKIASGGEMARFMLALKVILAETGAAQTLVFDEVDSGIGGATADAVGERLARLAQKRQILVVTHSPQVAAKSSHHSIVVKTGTTNPTTKILSLNTVKEREEEIARMLSGAEITKEARAAAAKLMEKSVA